MENLTEEQKKEVEKVFQYTDDAFYSDEDIAWAKKVFKKPEDFQRLRKVLQVLLPRERGLMSVNPQSLINTSVTDLNGYAIETAVNNLAEERVRTALFSFYRVVRSDIAQKQTREFEELNKKELEEEKKREEFLEKREEEERVVGKNL